MGIVRFVRRFGIDALFVGLPAAGAVAVLVFDLAIWMLVVCLVILVVGLISLLGDLGLFGRDDS